MKAIYQRVTPYSWDEQNPAPGDLTLIADQDGFYYYLSGSERTDADLTVGEWEDDGTLIGTIDPVYWTVWPLGNVGGVAPTSAPRAAGWQGHGFPLAQDPASAVGDPRFPQDDQPDSVYIRRKTFQDGEGFRVELQYGSDPTNKAIARYLDADYTQFHYTTGAFVLQASDWQVDESGDPLQVYATETPPGFRTASEESEYLGLWYGQLVAKSPLLLGQSEREAFYFTHDVGGGWVDSGETYTSLGGAGVFNVSSTAPFSVGQQIRISGNEYTITSVFNATTLVVTPTSPFPNPGDPIEVQQ